MFGVRDGILMIVSGDPGPSRHEDRVELCHNPRPSAARDSRLEEEA